MSQIHFSLRQNLAILAQAAGTEPDTVRAIGNRRGVPACLRPVFAGADHIHRSLLISQKLDSAAHDPFGSPDRKIDHVQHIIGEICPFDGIPLFVYIKTYHSCTCSSRTAYILTIYVMDSDT